MVTRFQLGQLRAVLFLIVHLVHTVTLLKTMRDV